MEAMETVCVKLPEDMVSDITREVRQWWLSGVRCGGRLRLGQRVYLLLFYWSIVYLQGCVTFCYRAQ